MSRNRLLLTNVKRLLTILLCICPVLLSAQTADEVVRNFLNKLDKQTLVTDFKVTVAEDATQPMHYNGTISMRGRMFVLNMFGMEAAYDGKTLYLYSSDTDELTLSNPTEEELTEANPLLYARALVLQSTLRFSPGTQKEGVWSVDFLPNYQTEGVKKFVLKLRKSDNMPIEIQIREGKQTTTLTLQNAKYQSAVPSFILSKPDAFLNDLR